jgi:hypothetical protein
MKAVLRLFSLLAVFALLLTACGGGTAPPLAVAGQPTLVFIYTDG